MRRTTGKYASSGASLTRASRDMAIAWARDATGLDFEIDRNEYGWIKLSNRTQGPFMALNVVPRVTRFLGTPTTSRIINDAASSYTWRISKTRTVELDIDFGFVTAVLTMTLTDTKKPNDPRF